MLDVEAGAVVSSRSFRYGDPEAAFAAAEHRVEASFRFPRCSSTPIECYAVLAEWDGASGETTVWSNVHGPSVMQRPIPARCMPYRTPSGGV